MLRRTVNRLADSYWPIPAACVALALALALGLAELDERVQREGSGIAFTGGPDSARSILSTISGSMLSLTALVFSITILVLQLASTQFSPRALRAFLRDRQNQLALGVFLATFVYALLALRAVRGGDGVDRQFVPGITITVSFLLVLASVGLFVRFIHHVSQSIRVVSIIDRIAAEARAAIGRSFPADAHAGASPPSAGAEPAPEPFAARQVVSADRPGVVAFVAIERVVALAAQADTVVRLVPCVGEFVATGMPLFEVAAPAEVDEESLRGTVDLARERDVRQDIGFGLRQLVDIAERALSPGINDPSTATQCIDQIHDLLRRLARSPYPATVHRDGDGSVRAIVDTMTWDDHVGLALDELRIWGSRSLQVRRRLEAMVEDLMAATVADPERRRPLTERMPLWQEPLVVGAG